jgi:hypothetical protein
MGNIRADKLIKESELIFYNDMGIKQVYYNDTILYNRESAYFYLKFENNKEET